MSRFPLWGLIFITLTALTIAKKNDDRNIEKVEIELDVLRGGAEVTYNDVRKGKAEVLYAQKKKIVAYKDAENEWCLLEKIQHKALVDGEHYFRQFRIVDAPLEKDQLEKLAGKKIVQFCAKHTSIILKPYSRDGRRGEPRRDERAKREVHPLQGNESQISHQEASKKLLEDLTHAHSLGSSRSSHGKDLKRNVDGNMENSREHYPSSSAKVAHTPGIDYHTHIRKNIFPGTHAVHPIDITSSVTITTGSSHKIWSYPPSSGGYHNTTATSHPSEMTNLQHGSHQNTSHISPHSFQGSLPYHPSSLDQNREHYPPSTNSKSRQSQAIYPPSSTSKTQAPAHYPPSPISNNHQGHAYYPPSSTSKSQQPSGYFPPSSTSKTHAVPHYPPSATTKTQRPSEYFPPSSSTKTQAPSYYVPSAAPKYQPPFGHYPPSSFGKTQGPAGYPPSATDKTHHAAGHYPPSSSGKPQQGKTAYSLSSGAKPEHDHKYYPPSSHSKTQGPASYPPSATDKTYHTAGHYPLSSSSKTEAPAGYPPSATSKSQPSPAYYPPPFSSKPQQGKTAYSSSSGAKAEHDHKYYPPSSTSKSHYPPSATAKTHHSAEHYPPSSASKPVHDQYPPSSTTKTHHFPSNVTAGSLTGGGRQYSVGAVKFPSSAQYSPSGSQSSHNFAASHHERPTYLPPSSTSKIHYRPKNGTHFQHSTLHSYEVPPGMYAPQFPPSSTSKLYSSQRFPSSSSSVNYVPQSKNHGFHHHQHPHSLAQYPPSSSAKFHPKSEQTGGQTPHFPPSSTSKTHVLFGMHDSGAPVLEKPSAEGSSHEHGSYPTSSSAKEHPVAGDIPQYPLSSTSKSYYGPSGGYIYGGAHKSHSYSPSRNDPPSTPPSAQIPQPPVVGHFHSSLHIHSFSSQHYPPSASDKEPHIPHFQTQQPIAHFPSSTAQLHPAPKQNVTKHLAPGYYPPSSTNKLQPSSVGHHHNFHSGHLAPAHVPYYPPSSHSKSINTLNEGGHSHAQHHPHHVPPSSWHHMHNESSIGPEKSLPPSPVGHNFYSQPQYPPSSSSRLHPNSSENAHPSPAIALFPSGAHYYPNHPQYNVTISHHHQYQQPNTAHQPHDKPQFQQGSAKPCQGSRYSVTTRTIVTPNGVIQRPVSVKSNGESPCGNVKQGTAPHPIPCGSVIKNGHTVKVQGPCISNQPNQRMTTRNVLVPGPAMMPGKKTSEQNEFSNSDGVVITNVGESEAEMLEGIGYPNSHQQFSHLKENSTIEEMVEDFESGGNQTKVADADEREKVEDVKEDASLKEEEQEEEEEVKEGDVLEPGDRILGKDGYTISDGLRGRVVSVSGQVGKTRTTKTDKKSNSAKFRYSLELGRYSKEDEEKRFSDCHGEVTFTCSEFLGSNGRAKICKPNPRRNPDGSPC